MNCIEFERLLSQAVEERHPILLPKLCDHAARCRSCRRDWEDHIILEEALASWGASTPEVDLVDAVMARLAEESSLRFAASDSDGDALQPARSAEDRSSNAITSLPQTTKPQSVRPRSRIRPFGSTLSIAVLVLLLVWRVSDERQPVLQPPIRSMTPGSQSGTVTTREQRGDAVIVAAERPKIESSPQGGSDTAELRLLVSEARSIYWLFAEDAAGAVDDIRILLPIVDSLVSTDQRASPEPAVEDNWTGEGWQHDLTPIRQKVGRALGFLWDAVPLDSVPTT